MVAAGDLRCWPSASWPLFYVAGPPREPTGSSGGGVSFARFLAIPRAGPILLVLFFVNFIGRSFTPILPLYLRELGVSGGRLASATGILISAYSVAAALSASSFGRASARRDPRMLLIASLVGGAALVLPMAFVSNYASFMALAILLGLAAGGSLTLCYTIGGLLVPKPTIAARPSAIFSAAALFGGALSPTVAGGLSPIGTCAGSSTWTAPCTWCWRWLSCHGSRGPGRAAGGRASGTAGRVDAAITRLRPRSFAA